MWALQAQKTTRLCIVRDLTEADVVARIMRKENYLIGLLNRGVLALHVPVPGLRKRLMLTKTLEWNLHWRAAPLLLVAPLVLSWAGGVVCSAW